MVLTSLVNGVMADASELHDWGIHAVIPRRGVVPQGAKAFLRPTRRLVASASRAAGPANRVLSTPSRRGPVDARFVSAHNNGNPYSATASRHRKPPPQEL